MNTIFIQIASYRDPQLPFTIEDCLRNAAYPENLRFGIAWQHGPEETLPQYRPDSSFRIIDIPYQESRGVCWARNSIQQLYRGETYTLQLDSHHRFISGWDRELIGMLQQLKKKGHDKPLITGYPPRFEPENDPEGRVHIPKRMNFGGFDGDGLVYFSPAPIPDWESLTEPLPARFYSAGFCFADGRFCVEVPHDPNWYFQGEEISIAVRAFTSGYDLFHSHKVLVWHQYSRKGSPKHWEDDKDWGRKHRHSIDRYRALFRLADQENDVDLGQYDFGSARTLADYERFAGISFARRSVQKFTLQNRPPPNPTFDSDEQYLNSFLPFFEHSIRLDKLALPERDYDFWIVGYYDTLGQTIYRHDVYESEIVELQTRPGREITLSRGFYADLKPDQCIVKPHSRSKGWCTEIDVGVDDLAMSGSIDGRRLEDDRISFSRD
jgi:hypothetical protein